MKMNIQWIAVLLILLMSSVSAKSDINKETGEFDLVYKPETTDDDELKTDVKAQASCSVQFSTVDDVRRNKETIGTNYRVPLRPRGVTQWLATLSTEVQSRVPSSSSTDQAVTVKPELLKLYTYAESMNLHGVMAIKLHYFKGQEKINTGYVRAYGIKANWINGIGEYRTVANRTMSNMVEAIIGDINRVCAEA